MQAGYVDIEATIHSQLGGIPPPGSSGCISLSDRKSPGSLHDAFLCSRKQLFVGVIHEARSIGDQTYSSAAPTTYLSSWISPGSVLDQEGVHIEMELLNSLCLRNRGPLRRKWCCSIGERGTGLGRLRLRRQGGKERARPGDW